MLSNSFPPDFTRERPVADKGIGSYIYTDDGKRYLDGSSGAMTSNIGHTVPEVGESIKNQIDKITFAYRGQFTTIPLEELSTCIASLAPGDLNKVSLVNSGSEANELAMKLACDYWNSAGLPQKKRIISRWPSYHGSTMGALSMSGNPARRKQYTGYLNDWPVIEVPFCHHCPYDKSYPECKLFCAKYLQKLINRLGSNTISAVICEPITGASGAGITPPDEYFPMLRDICNKNNILLIIDEVITGFGRTGENFASNHWDIVPDMITFGKGVSSGYGPMAGVLVKDEIFDRIFQNGNTYFLTGHTHGGNPLCAAGALAVLNYMEKNNVISSVKEKGAYIEKKLEDLYKKFSIVTDYRGKGLLWGVELAQGKASNEPFPKEFGMTVKMVNLCFENGLIVYPSQGFIDGVLGDSILLSPSFLISYDEIDKMFTILEDSIKKLGDSIK